MPELKLSMLAILLGTGFALPQAYGLLRPASLGEAMRKFPRSEVWGYVLMLGGTAWFLYNLKTDSISDFAAFKPLMLIGFAVIGIGACVYVRDYLAVRGLAVVLLLLAKLVLDTARWADTQWRLVLVVWAYLWVIGAVWFSISPWRLRDIIQFITADERRVRIFSACRLALALLVLALGLTVFRQAAN
jgi:hypothetical protein